MTTPGVTLQRQVKIVGAATMLLYAAMVAMVLFFVGAQNSQNHSACVYQQTVGKAQISGITAELGTARNIARYEIDPNMREFFQHEAQLRRAALTKAEEAYAVRKSC